MNDQRPPMTEETVRVMLEDSGAEVMSRAGRTESYGSPRDFSFEVKGVFPNGMGLHIVARQFTYRDPWEAVGRINDLVDITLLRDGSYSALPKGYAWFQGQDMEEGVDEDGLGEIVAVVRGLNPKIYLLQGMTGD